MRGRRAFAPGRVTIIGEHTDYNAGRSLAMALTMGTTATSIVGPGDELLVRTTYDNVTQAASIRPSESGRGSRRYDWVAVIAALAASFGIEAGGLELRSDLPIGAGLSSSASLALAVALSFGAQGSPFALARICQSAERAGGSDVGLLDQVTIAAGREGFGVAIDFSTESTGLVAIAPGAEFVVIHSGQQRSLATSGYQDRRYECEQAAAIIGPLGTCSIDTLGELTDPVLRARARHVISECARVGDTEQALARGDFRTVGQLLLESHASLATDFAVSTPRIDAMVRDLASTPGVYGARMVGGGFGGCILALCERRAIDPSRFGDGAWVVTPGNGAVATDLDDEF